MGWERGRYYTRSLKVGGRVVREYIGGGEAGTLIAQLDAIEREKRETERQVARATAERLTAADAPLIDFENECDLLVRAALLAAGFRRHHRGEWRKQRGAREESE